MPMLNFDPNELAWPCGKSVTPRGLKLWVPMDWSTCVLGIPGTGKTICELVPALLTAPGAALFAGTKAGDIYLTVTARQRRGPVVVLDPLGMAPGLPEMVWDPIAGCVSSFVAERRGLAFALATLNKDASDEGARYYAFQAAEVLKCLFHAAALTGRDLRHVLAWINDPDNEEAETILAGHDHASPNWDGALRKALRGDPKTVANTLTTLGQAMSVFSHAEIVNRCVATPRRPATDIEALIRAGGTIYLLGKDDQYTKVTTLLTAVAEEVLDTVERLGTESPHGRLAPPFVACIDELPSIAPIPSLPQRLADGRGRGLCILYAAQAWQQIANRYGESEARAMLGITGVLIIFGGGNDDRFNTEVSSLIGTAMIQRSSLAYGADHRRTISLSEQREAILQPHEIAQLPKERALILADVCPPIIARTPRAIDGRAGKRLLAEAAALRDTVNKTRGNEIDPAQRAAAALTVALGRNLTPKGFGYELDTEGGLVPIAAPPATGDDDGTQQKDR
jgi:type IV secretion system protein VirD4